MLNEENFDYSKINCDCTLSYDIHKDIFSLHIPYYTERKVDNSKHEIVGIDPGLKTFLTCVSNNHIYKIGNNIINKFRPKLEYIDKLNLINNKRTRKRVLKIYTKMKNQIIDLHWKSINYLLKIKNSGGIIIGNLSTKDVSSKKKHLQPMYKRLLGMLSLYKFRDRLKFKCDEYNIPYVLSDESYTSKTCCKCSHLNDKIKHRTLKCSKCNYKIDRDINGALNILFKNV